MDKSAEQDKTPATKQSAVEESVEISKQDTSFHFPSVDELKGKWKEHVGAAKIVWGKLTDDELLRAEGEAQKLIGLIQQRYAITHEEAERQVKHFLDKLK
jgi:uncharacterized protein YjbJ (UPF0337 family)